MQYNDMEIIKVYKKVKEMVEEGGFSLDISTTGFQLFGRRGESLGTFESIHEIVMYMHGFERGESSGKFLKNNRQDRG